MSCKHCNFFNTEKCGLYAIWDAFEEGELTEDEANEQSDLYVMTCEDKYHDWLIDQGDIRDGR